MKDTPHNRVVQQYLDRGFHDRYFRLFLRMYLVPEFTTAFDHEDVMQTYRGEPHARFHSFSAMRHCAVQYFKKHPEAKREWDHEINESYHPRAVPDAWRVIEATVGGRCELELIEVHDTHKLSQEKLAGYFNWQDADDIWRASIKEVSVTAPATECDVAQGMHTAWYREAGVTA